ncbi:Sec1-like protein [Coemansia reversa NRRL 1564]|uniref:Sec1-like protein n=1 Tax=Coemansia reversa (strain ATCC 12441 / NRRL 1564) TaxID=763665 RepID=A0A2G5BJM5_COERN|nr:Sec1-like protein [Coemansia reversa NRRL 1564]|eukprot:PIA18947.1 Sec1-like protein [Coemansia reversa NRRL 1564]
MNPTDVFLCMNILAAPRAAVEIIEAISTPTVPGKWRVVVADRPSLSIISSVLKMHAILEQNVVAIQLITRSRQPYPDMDAVYILVPSADSVSRVIEDFRYRIKTVDARHCQYAGAHLFFTGALSDTLLAHLQSSPAAPYIKSTTELYIEYNPIESRVFLTTPSEQPFYALYSPHASSIAARNLDAAADRLLSVIVSLGITPYIRYYRPAHSALRGTLGKSTASISGAAATAIPHIAESMTAHIQMKLNEHYTHEKGSLGIGQKHAENMAPAVIIVLDRSVDMFAPLLHDFTYQGAVHDLLDLEDGNRHTYVAGSSSGYSRQIVAELAEQKDPLWKKLRHWHIGDVSQYLADQYEKLVRDNVGIQAASKAGKKMTIQEMKAAVSELPEFKQLQDLYSPHIDLASKCLDIIKKNDLLTLLEFEQEMVTGKDIQGKPTDRTNLEKRLIALLDNDVFSALDRRRLEEVPRCLSLNDKCAVVNLQRLGISTDRDGDAANLVCSNKKFSWNAASKINRDNQKPGLEPAVKRIIQEQLSGELCTELFPWAEEAPPEGIPKNFLNMNATSLQRNKSGWRHRNKTLNPNTDKRGVVIVYIAGGVTLAEMRSVYELADSLQQDIYIGSTHMITPRGFLDNMKRLHLNMLF